MSSSGRQYYLFPLSLCTLMLLLAGCASTGGGAVTSAAQSGVTKLAACPNRPSCVVSRNDAGAHAVEALAFDGPAAKALAHVSEILTKMPRTRVIKSDAHYLHVTQGSRWLHFTDDVEFLLDPRNGRIDVRSCSRVGYYDFGVNRARVEMIRDALNPPQ